MQAELTPKNIIIFILALSVALSANVLVRNTQRDCIRGDRDTQYRPSESIRTGYSGMPLQNSFIIKGQYQYHCDEYEEIPLFSGLRLIGIAVFTYIFYVFFGWSYEQFNKPVTKREWDQ